MPTIRRCCIIGCQSNSRQNPNLQFFQFPRPENPFHKLWKTACHASLRRILPFKKPVICALHFDASCLGGRRLVSNAVPTQRLEVPTNLEQVEQQAMVEEIERSRKCAYINAVVYEWLVRANTNPQLRGSITHGMIKEKAENARQIIGSTSFIADNRWLNRFRETHLTGFAQKLATNQLKPMGTSLWVPDIVHDLQHLFPPASAERVAKLDEMPEQYLNYMQQYGEYEEEEEDSGYQESKQPTPYQLQQQQQHHHMQQVSPHTHMQHPTTTPPPHHMQQAPPHHYNPHAPFNPYSQHNGYNNYHDYYYERQQQHQYHQQQQQQQHHQHHHQQQQQHHFQQQHSHQQQFHHEPRLSSLSPPSEQHMSSQMNNGANSERSSPFQPVQLKRLKLEMDEAMDETTSPTASPSSKAEEHEHQKRSSSTRSSPFQSIAIQKSENDLDSNHGSPNTDTNSNDNAATPNTESNVIEDLTDENDVIHTNNANNDNSNSNSNSNSPSKITNGSRTPRPNSTNGQSSASASPKQSNSGGSIGNATPTNGHTSPSSESIFKELDNYAQALEYLKPLEDFVLFKENFRAIGLLSQLEAVLKRGDRATLLDGGI